MGTELTIAATLQLTPAKKLQAEIECEVANVVAGEFSLSRGYAKLARLLALFKLNEGWRETGHASFNSYLLSLKEKYNRSAQQLYAYVSVAEKLLPLIGEDALDKMGVTKAIEITKASSRAKRAIPAELIEAALDDNTDVDQIRALAHRLFELRDNQQPKGKYLDLGGFYVDDEQYATWCEAFKISMMMLNLPKEMPDWQKKKLVFMFWAQEIHGTYAAEAFGPDGK